MAVKQVLSYVNEQDRTINYDREFDTVIRLMAFVNEQHPEWTSYQTVVCRVPASEERAWMEREYRHAGERLS